jgi:hypothetical protein
MLSMRPWVSESSYICPLSKLCFLLKPFKNGLTLHQAQVYVPSQNRKRCDTLLSEVDAVLKDRLATIDDIPTLPNTRQVVTESMRLYPLPGSSAAMSRAPTISELIQLPWPANCNPVST